MEKGLDSSRGDSDETGGPRSHLWILGRGLHYKGALNFSSRKAGS